MQKLKARNFCFFIFFQIILLGDLHSQITIRIIEIPDNTPPNDTLYISGSFNNWNAADPKYRLIPDTDSSYLVRVNSDSFEYKFTRGNWIKVEGNATGGPVSNRSTYGSSTNDVLSIRVLAWEDLEQLKIVVTKIPKLTPSNSDIYLSGDFNYWNPRDPIYKLHLNEEGNYELILPSFLKSFSYKFTRGDWPSAESNAVGRPTPNRIIDRAKLSNLVVENEIYGWSDLSGTDIDFFILILSISVFLGFFASITLYQIKSDKRGANSSLMYLLIIVSSVILVKILLYNQSIYHWIPKLLLIPGFLLFLFAPLLYNHTRKLVLPAKPMELKEYFYFFIPIVILIVIYVPLVPMNNEQFILKVINQDFYVLFSFISGGGILFNIIYSYRLVRLIKYSSQKMDTTRESFKSLYTYLSYLAILFFLIIFIALVTYIVSFYSIFYLNIETTSLIEKVFNLVWIGVAMFPIVVLYFLIIKPDIFRKSERKQSTETSSDLKKQLASLMESKKPYLQADLTLSTLAEMLDTNPHTLSKVLNEGYSKSFFEYINGYRVADFKTRINKGYYRHQTFLAIAFDVGFSSKTTFNRTFKKITGITPRSYLYSIKDEEIRMKLKSGE